MNASTASRCEDYQSKHQRRLRHPEEAKVVWARWDDRRLMSRREIVQPFDYSTACSRARVTSTRRPKSGRAVPAEMRRSPPPAATSVAGSRRMLAHPIEQLGDRAGNRFLWHVRCRR